MSWIKVQEFAAEHDLQVLAHNLQAAQLAHRFTDEQDGQILWVLDSKDEAQVREVLNVFLRQPDKIFPVAEIKPGMSLAIPSFRSTPLTYILLALGVIGYCFSFAPFAVRAPLLFFPISLSGSVWPAAWHYWVATSEYWRLISPAFLHWSAAHIIFNGLALVDFGGRLERQLPRGVYLGLFLFTAIVSNVGQFTFVPQTNFGGLSGALFGFFGCILAIQWLVPKSPLNLPLPFILLSTAMLIAGILGFLDRIIGPMANWAHLTGLAAGFVYGCAVAPFLKRHLEAQQPQPTNAAHKK
ncbi:MAG: hypothetical protein RL497_1052 [Pseudomonadota bacterium]